MKFLHIPVLLDEISTAFEQAEKTSFSYLDCTLGCGGHAKLLLEKHKIDRFVGVDRDTLALEAAKRTLEDLLPDNSKIIHTDFVSFGNQAIKEEQKFDFILMDLGISSLQIDDTLRGFSFRFGDAPLDMRMNNIEGPTAADLVNKLSEKRLREILLVGEVIKPHKVAEALCRFRAKRPIKTVKDLINAAGNCLWRTRKIHPATLLFQALRMEVNQELAQLDMMLEMIPSLLSTKGIVAVLTFQSLEDRKVKHFLRLQDKNSILKLIHKKALTASKEEQKRNPRSRSAKLRLAQRL